MRVIELFIRCSPYRYIHSFFRSAFSGYLGYAWYCTEMVIIWLYIAIKSYARQLFGIFPLSADLLEAVKEDRNRYKT